MEILRPFATPVGRVGLSICFDVREMNHLTFYVSQVWDNRVSQAHIIPYSYASPRSVWR